MGAKQIKKEHEREVAGDDPDEPLGNEIVGQAELARLSLQAPNNSSNINRALKP